MYLNYILPLFLILLIVISVAYIRTFILQKKKKRILNTISDTAVFLKDVSGDIYIESSIYTRWIVFDKIEVVLDKSTIYLFPNEKILGNNLRGIVQIDVDKNNHCVNENAALHLMLNDIKSERKYIKLIGKETEVSAKKYEVLLNFNNLPDKEIVLNYLSNSYLLSESYSNYTEK